MVSHSHNSEIDESAFASGGAKKKPGRSLWKTLAALCTVLVIGVGMVWGLSSMRQKRTEFVGRVDPATGERCRFTLAVDWKREKNNMGTSAQGLWDFDTFTAPPPSPIRKWIATHLFHSSTTQGNVTAIHLISLKLSGFPNFLQIQGGYPELPAGTSLRQFSSHRHLVIDGCPATMMTASDKQSSGVILMVYIPKSSTMYVLSGHAALSESTRIDHEMQAIVSSFHIDKGAVPPRDKR